MLIAILQAVFMLTPNVAATTQLIALVIVLTQFMITHHFAIVELVLKPLTQNVTILMLAILVN